MTKSYAVLRAAAYEIFLEKQIPHEININCLFQIPIRLNIQRLILQTCINFPFHSACQSFHPLHVSLMQPLYSLLFLPVFLSLFFVVFACFVLFVLLISCLFFVLFHFCYCFVLCLFQLSDYLIGWIHRKAKYFRVITLYV